MNKLYILTGPAGVGKSTISSCIANNLPKSVLIEGDDIYHQVVGGYIQAWKEGNHLKTFWKVCFNSIKTYLEDGYDVIFNYIIDKKDFNEIKKQFKEYEIKFVVLLVDEKTILERDAKRPEDCQMKERCLVLLDSFQNKHYDDNYLLYTDNLTINETYQEILKNNRFIVK